jgi:heme oxygenase
MDPFCLADPVLPFAAKLIYTLARRCSCRTGATRSRSGCAPRHATTYCTRLREAAFADAPGFIAHHYTRYLGDLSGGQYLGQAVARAYRLSADGRRFFVFDGVDPFEFKTRYRQMLDALTWSRSQERVFLTEVEEAHRLNAGLLTELKERWT